MDQSQEGGEQIISVTQSASIAAISDRHVFIERNGEDDSDDSGNLGKWLNVSVRVTEGSLRTVELVRMATGYFDVNEKADSFEKALLREGLHHREELASAERIVQQ